MPALTSSSLNLPIAVSSSVLGMTPASESLLAFTITMNCIVTLRYGLAAGCNRRSPIRRIGLCSTDISVKIISEVIAAAGCGKLFSLLGHLIRLLDENPILIRRTEIHIDAPYLVAREHKKLGVAKPFSAFGRAPVGHEGRVAVDKDSFQLMSLDPFGVLPATREIARLVDAIVVGAGETKVVGERILD